MATASTRKSPGYRTEYTDNYTADRLGTGSWNASSSGLFDGKASGKTYPVGPVQYGSSQPPPASGTYQPASGAYETSGSGLAGDVTAARDPTVFASQIYPSVYRESVIHKDDRGHYIDPFQGLASKPYGRRLMYDKSHPDKMYASQWSSELADHPGCYSFPTTTGLDPEIPFKQDLQWQAEGETGSWPTDTWKSWTQVACSPPYDGHDDQVEYSQYKVQVP